MTAVKGKIQDAWRFRGLMCSFLPPAIIRCLAGPVGGDAGASAVPRQPWFLSSGSYEYRAEDSRSLERWWPDGSTGEGVRTRMEGLW